MNEHDYSSDFDFPTPPPDPNSPERKRAARFGVASKICKVLGFVSIGVMVAGTVILQDNSSVGWFLVILPAILLVFLSGILKNQELKLRCTIRTTAHCIYTVRRHRNKSVRNYPVVEYEVKGVNHTAELPVSCPRHSEGQAYTIYYDPLDPDVVRPERRGLFD